MPASSWLRSTARSSARDLFGRSDWPPGTVITGADEPNLRVVREMDTGHDDDPEWFPVLVVEPV